MEIRAARTIERRDFFLHSPATTNNRMALSGAIAALQLLGQKGNRLRLLIVSDSEYLVKGIREWVPGWQARGWTRKAGPIENLELWRVLHASLSKHDAQFTWVRGHAGHPKNEYANDLAVRAATDAGDIGRNRSFGLSAYGWPRSSSRTVRRLRSRRRVRAVRAATGRRRTNPAGGGEMTELEQFAAALMTQWRADGGADGAPIGVGALLDKVLPYRVARRTLGIDVSEDYEALVLQLLAEDEDLVRVEPVSAADMAKATITSRLPDLDALQLLRSAQLTVYRARDRAA